MNVILNSKQEEIANSKTPITVVFHGHRSGATTAIREGMKRAQREDPDIPVMHSIVHYPEAFREFIKPYLDKNNTHPVKIWVEVCPVIEGWSGVFDEYATDERFKFFNLSYLDLPGAMEIP